MNPSEQIGDSTEEMAGRANDPSENSGLMRNANKSQYINLINNISAVICFIILTYLSFRDQAVLFSYHPVFMTLGWLVLMPTAINAITPGDAATDWLPIRLRSSRHWMIQAAAGTFALAGFFIIVSNKIINSKPHFVSLHAILGLISVIFMTLTATGGLGALYSLKLKRFLPPIIIKLIHSFFGLVTLALGTLTMILGLYTKWFGFGEALRYVCFFLIITVFVLTILRPGLKIYVRARERFERV